MLTGINKLIESSCNVDKKEKVCRSRGGESCAFDGAMIVLQPIADTAHIVHGPIACAGNSWEGRGTLSSKGDLHKLGFTTDMIEMDIVYGAEEKLYNSIMDTYRSVVPKAIFVYSTCVSGLIGEDIAAVCKKAEEELSVPVIPVHSPGFVGPKNLGNRIAGEVLLEHVIGTGKPEYTTESDINLIGEYNIAGDLWLVEPVLKKAGIRVLSRITGDATFEEITYAHRAKLNVVVCSRALINIAREMERKYDIPYIEISFFGRTEMAKALRAIGAMLKARNPLLAIDEEIEAVIAEEEAGLAGKLKKFAHLKGKRAVLYTGGVKSWSMISALRDLGIDILAVGTKKSTYEDEEKMKALLGENAPLVEDVAAKNLIKLMKEGRADMLIAGGRNQYLAMKEGYPFVDVNQERHIAYAGYDGLVNLAEQISNSIEFFNRQCRAGAKIGVGFGGISLDAPVQIPSSPGKSDKAVDSNQQANNAVINPLKHSPALGAAIAFQGVDNALPIIHSAQGCGFLGKVLLTKHFREPVALANTRLFTEDVVMGSDEALTKVAEGFIEKNKPEVVGILSSALSEVKGDDVPGAIKTLKVQDPTKSAVIHISTPDYDGGLESGYAKAVEGLLAIAEHSLFTLDAERSMEKQVNVLTGSHLTPADFTELREIIESFGLRPIMLPDLSALDGSRQDFSALATGGTKAGEIRTMRLSEHTLAIGASMGAAAEMLKDKFEIDYTVLESVSGLEDTGALMETLSRLSGKPVPAKYERQRRILTDGMRDAHFYYGGKKICLALEPDLSIQVSRWLYEMGANIELAVLPTSSASMYKIRAKEVTVGDLFSIEGDFDALISNSHGEDMAKKLGVPLYQMGFPVYKVLGSNSRITIGYRGTLNMINEIGNLLMPGH